MSATASNSTGSRGPMPGPSGSGTNTAVTVQRTKSEKEKKVGHRRVTQGGDVTYKKIQTSQIMGSIQLGVQHAIGGLASKPERDLLMQVSMCLYADGKKCYICQQGERGGMFSQVFITTI